MEPKDLFTIDEKFLTDGHNLNGCLECHSGKPGVHFKDTAHEGYVTDPSAEPDKYCAACHQENVGTFQESLHANQTGFQTLLLARAGVTELTKDMEEMLSERCGECHGTCGQCHISEPDIAEGGLIDGHIIKKTPNQAKNCNACHSRTVGDEYTGSIGFVDASVHYTSGMQCLDCHTEDEIHGNSSSADSRYNVTSLPECLDCHDGLVEANNMHKRHYGELQCQVCHSQPYRNCYLCHVAQPEEEGPFPHGLRYPERMDFRIGENPIKSTKRPWDISLLRHIPVYEDSFVEYDIELLEFTSLPTWKYTSPHNILRNTPQNGSCGSCMGNSNLFLTEFYLEMRKIQGLMTEAEIEANQSVIMEKVPE